MEIKKEIDLTVEIGCGDFFKYIKENLSQLRDNEVISIIVKGYAERFTIVEWIKHIGHSVINEIEEGEKTKIIVR